MHNIDKACLFFKALSDETRLKIVGRRIDDGTDSTA